MTAPEQTRVHVDDDLDSLLVHYVRKTFIGSGVPTNALCGVVDVWPARTGAGSQPAWSGIICPTCEQTFSRMKP